MPKPKYPPGSPLATHLAGMEANNRFLEATSGISDEQLRKYMDKVSSYSIKLRKWLQDVEVARADRVRLFGGRLRIHEAGQAPDGLKRRGQ